MTVSTDIRSVVRAGNGLATEFSFSFPVPEAEHVVVTLLDAEGDGSILSADLYEVDLQPVGGSVTYPLSGAPLADGTSLQIERVLPLVQDTDLANQGAFFAETHEDVFDRTVMMIQQVSDRAGQAIKVPLGEVVGALPAAAQRANRLLSFGGDGAPETRLSSETIDAITAISDDVTELAGNIDTIAANASVAQSASLAASAAQTAAQTAAQASGVSRWFQTHSDMTAALADHADEDVVGVFEDETRNGQAALYRRETGSWVFKLIVFSQSRKIYVAMNGGSDANSGLTDTAPIQTITRLLQMLRNGDQVFFRRGDEWECGSDAELNIDGFSDVLIDAYGNGPDPRISGKERLSGISLQSGHVYFVDVVLPEQTVPSRNYAMLCEDFIPLAQLTLGNDDEDSLPDGASFNEIIADLEANPGKFYFTGGTLADGWAAGTHRFYFHARDSSDPRSNGLVYQSFKTNQPVRLGERCTCRNILIDHGFGHNGYQGAGNTYWENVTAINPARHHCLLERGRLVNCVHIHQNRRHSGSFFHTNPGSLYSPGDTQHGCRGCIAVGDPDLEVPLGTAYFCHGSPAPVVDEMIYIDCEAYNVSQVFGQTDINKLRAVRTIARNFTSFYNGEISGEVLFDGLTAIGGTNRWATLSGESAELRIERAYIDTVSENFFFSTNGSAAVSVKRSMIVHNPVRRDGGAAQFFSLGNNLGSRDTQGKISIRDTYYIAPTHINENFIRLPAAPAAGYDIENFIIGVPGHRNLVIDEGDLTTNLDEHSAFSGDTVYRVKASDIIGSHTPGEKLVLKYGAIAPRDLIAVDCAYSQDGANQPRSLIIVGDRIWDLSANDSLAEMVAVPSVRLRAVCFADTVNGARYISVGPKGTIWNSNAGSSQIWTERATPNDTASLRAIALDVSGEALAVGDNGVIWRSTDDGVTWAAINSGVSLDLTSVDTDGVNFLIGTASRSILQVPVGSTSVTELPNQVGNSNEARMVFNDALNSLWIIGATNGDLRTSPNGGSPSFTNRPQPHEASWVGFARTTDRIVAILQDDHSTNSVQISTSENGIDWQVEPTSLPFRPTGIGGPGASFFGGRGLTIVGETRVRADSWDGRNWTINPIDTFNSDRYRAANGGEYYARIHQI